MSAVITLPAPAEARPRIRRPAFRLASPTAPFVAAIINAAAFLVVRPNVGDLQAALARQLAASSGVGLKYWFQWFGGGTTPGHYSVLSPYLSSFIGALWSGAIATVVMTPLVHRALVGTRYQLTGTWVATIVAGCNIWSGRVPFALGCAMGVIALIGVRERRVLLAFVGALGAVLSSPVTGAFLGFGLFTAFLVERDYRRMAFLTGAVTGSALISVALYFGSPGPQGYTFVASLIASGSALIMLLARPAPGLRLALWLTAIAAPLISEIPNGLGSNYARLPWICLPAAVVATAHVRRTIAIAAVVPAVICCAQTTVVDLRLSRQPAASASYYRSLIARLSTIPNLANYRLEVVQDIHIHAAAYQLIRTAAIAGGYETQEQNALNSVLKSVRRLNAVSYKVWLDNSAVGYVAFDKRTEGDTAEYNLVRSGTLDYLTPIWSDRTWTLYKVRFATPIVLPPEKLVSATQSALSISVPCACKFNVRVRYSKFLTATDVDTGLAANVQDDLTGWTVVQTSAPGTYNLRG